METKPKMTALNRRFFAQVAGVDVSKVDIIRFRRIVPLAALILDTVEFVEREVAPARERDDGLYTALAAVAIRVAIAAERTFGFDLATMIAAIETQPGAFVEAVRRAEMGRNTWFGLSIDHATREVVAAAGPAEHVAVQVAGWQAATSARPSVVAMVHVSPIVQEVVAILVAAQCYQRKIVPPDFIVGDETGREAA